MGIKLGCHCGRGRRRRFMVLGECKYESLRIDGSSNGGFVSRGENGENGDSGNGESIEFSPERSFILNVSYEMNAYNIFL